MSYDRIKNLGSNHNLLYDFATGKERATLRTFAEWCYFYPPQNCHTKYLRFRINPFGSGFITVVRYGSDRKTAERFVTASITKACEMLFNWLVDNKYIPSKNFEV